jgi:hypothetical protein
MARNLLLKCSTLLTCIPCLFVTACGGRDLPEAQTPLATEPMAAPPPSVTTLATAPTPPPPPPPSGPVEVNDKEHPVMRCGAKDSYYYVATEFKCADGSNPLGGETMAGAKARVGNVGANSTGHIIDLYEVPCPEGAKRVYVDMYGCPAGGKI